MDLEQNCLPSDWYNRAARDMVDCLVLLDEGLPPLALQALEVGRRYWDGKATERELDAMRSECWSIVKGKGQRQDLDVRAIRAVLCVLYPKPQDEDVVELLTRFAYSYPLWNLGLYRMSQEKLSLLLAMCGKKGTDLFFAPDP